MEEQIIRNIKIVIRIRIISFELFEILRIYEQGPELIISLN